ncbi:MAG: hypothetical protein HPY50_05930 [Firmicutes bacterium]|nr:hypothetical protein [Bacillota bacterium]
MREDSTLLTPAQVGQLLKIAPDQLKWLNRRGWLEAAQVVRYRNGEMSLFEREKVLSLIPQMPNLRRAWMAEENQRYGGSTAARKREEDRRQAEGLKNRKQRFLADLTEIPEPFSHLLKAGFYLYHLNHYAKRGETYLYDLKEQVLRLLVGERESFGPSLKVLFVPGSERVRLCSRCQERADRLGKSRPEYIRLYGGCTQCSRDENYYSLYEFIISYEDYRFCFHVPFMTARKWFKEWTPPAKEGRPEREGFSVYGRPIFAAETQAVEMIEVVEELEALTRPLDPEGEDRSGEGPDYPSAV